jgi:hypothetical protein
MTKRWGLLLLVLLSCSKPKADAKAVASVTTPPAMTVAPAPVLTESVESYTARTTANYAGTTLGQKELGVQQCIMKGDACHNGTLDGILASGKTDKERAHLVDVENSALIQHAASAGDDGSSISAAALTTADALARAGSAKALSTIPTTTYAAAIKDSEKERGKVINASGNVVEIQADRSTGATLYQGAIMTDSGSVVRFICPLSTDGIVENSWVRFRGVFVQEYDYPNVAGGETKSVLLVGAFNP